MKREKIKEHLENLLRLIIIAIFDVIGEGDKLYFRAMLHKNGLPGNVSVSNNFFVPRNQYKLLTPFERWLMKSVID